MICEICKEEFIADGFKICIDCQQDETEKNFVPVERKDLEDLRKLVKNNFYGFTQTEILKVSQFVYKYLGKGWKWKLHLTVGQLFLNQKMIGILCLMI